MGGGEGCPQGYMCLCHCGQELAITFFRNEYITSLKKIIKIGSPTCSGGKKSKLRAMYG